MSSGDRFGGDGGGGEVATSPALQPLDVTIRIEGGDRVSDEAARSMLKAINNLLDDGHTIGRLRLK